MIKRQTIRILLINQENRLLLMRAVDPTTTGMDRTARAAFWCTIGGKLEHGETLEQAAARELYEETGFTTDDVILGPIVWYGRHEMIISGRHIELDEKFIVGHLKTNKQLSHHNFTDNEKSVVTNAEWLSLDEIINHVEPIFPIILKTKFPDILNKNYPLEPEWVDLSLQA